MRRHLARNAKMSKDELVTATRCKFATVNLSGKPRKMAANQLRPHTQSPFGDSVHRLEKCTVAAAEEHGDSVSDKKKLACQHQDMQVQPKNPPHQF